MARPIRFFAKSDPYFELSNFAPFGFEHEGVRWATVEHYFQAAKFRDEAHCERIRTAHSPKQAKTLGQSRVVPIRGDWNAVREEIMLFGLRKKFEDAGLRELLLKTGKRQLIEASPHDRYWGEGRDGSGKNRLGELLMQVRSEVAP